FFFFFQAEDGIRDFHVTGVQTCALPISPLPPAGEGWGEGKIAAAGSPSSGPAGHLPPEKGTEVPHAGEGKGVGLREHALVAIGRSEERRVGKECRSRGQPRHDNRTCIE